MMAEQKKGHKSTRTFDRKIIQRAVRDSFKKLNPKILLKNPVIFVVEVVAFLSTYTVLRQVIVHQLSDINFNIQVTFWLWVTVLFANFAEALAEGRGKAQAEALRKARSQTIARRLQDGKEEKINATELASGDIVVCEAGDIIPADGVVIEGIASVDESAITGESAPVIRESGEERSSVTGGTKVLSDRILVRITAEPGETFVDRMIRLVEGAKRQKTPNEIALTILLSALTIVFLLVVSTFPAFMQYAGNVSGISIKSYTSLPILASLLVCLVPTTIGGLLSAIGISGMDRLIKRNVIATSGRAAEAAGDVDVLLLDKTGTITLGNRMAADFLPAPGVTVERLAEAAQLSSIADETPEGRSIVILAKEKYGLRATEVRDADVTFIPFSAQTKMSGVDIPGKDGREARSIRKGSGESIKSYVASLGKSFPSSVQRTIDEVARNGSTPLVVVENGVVLGVVELKDVVKGGIKERFAQLRKMGIRTVMITGDNALTAAAIAAEAGVDDFIAEAKPEDKLERIRAEQANGHLVGMIGDGTNDAPALAQADVGIAMNSGTQAAREAGNMVDLDSNPTKLIEVVEIGKQLLMTRGALTTFSIANDVSKYFAIIPAMTSALYAFGKAFGPLEALNIMKLGSPQSAILSAVIFNALIIVLLVPLALKGVKYRPAGAGAILKRNLLIYGAGGLIAPFIGIKLIDLLINALKIV
ncbi:MAG: potassium-transporting ATPase subunit KdpB [Candidatus Kryptoniota bacterium]